MKGQFHLIFSNKLNITFPTIRAGCYYYKPVLKFQKKTLNLHKTIHPTIFIKKKKIQTLIEKILVD